jgi:hypothetical protein
MSLLQEETAEAEVPQQEQATTDSTMLMITKAEHAKAMAVMEATLRNHFELKLSGLERMFEGKLQRLEEMLTVQQQPIAKEAEAAVSSSSESISVITSTNTNNNSNTNSKKNKNKLNLFGLGSNHKDLNNQSTSTSPPMARSRTVNDTRLRKQETKLLKKQEKQDIALVMKLEAGGASGGGNSSCCSLGSKDQNSSSLAPLPRSRTVNDSRLRKEETKMLKKQEKEDIELVMKLEAGTTRKHKVRAGGTPAS